MSLLEHLPNFAEEAVGVDDFRAAYDVVKCVCFRSHRTETDTIASFSQVKGGVELHLQSNENETKDVVGRKRRRCDSRSSRSFSPLVAAKSITLGECRLSSSSPSLLLPLSIGHRQILDVIRESYKSASPKDQKSWNVENEGEGNRVSSKSPSEFLSSTTKPEPSSKNWSNENGHTDNAITDGYCSFVLQDDSNGAVSSFTNQMENHAATNPSTRKMLPHCLLLTSTNNALTENEENDATEKYERKKMIHPLPTMAPHYWIFVGRNKHCESGEWLSGRREHTDSIEHDGTFHHQVLGSKLWKLRPTLELRELCDRDHDLALLDSYEVLVEEGDVFVINTKLWWHQTEIPPGWSVSYARDLYLDGNDVGVACDGATNRESGKRHSNGYGFCYGTESDLESDATDHHHPAQESVGNVEVSWASGFIPSGTTLVVHCVIDDDEEDGNECTNIDGDSEVSSLYHRLVPPTIGRTRLASRANCKMVLLSTEPGPNDCNFDSEQGCEETSRKDFCSKAAPRQISRRRQLALKAIRDIREGEEFMMLFKEKDV